jgi:aminoglycoside phosphotransferase (APT) family kinase protein
MGVIDVTPAGIALRLYDDDPRLPWLAAAVDPAGMRDRFATLLPDTSVEACAPAPVRYRSGVRCVFRYDVATAAGPRVFFGKLLAEGGAQLMATVDALHGAATADSRLPRIPRPLAYWPEIRMLVQPEVAGGAELNDLAFDPAQEAGLRERWLRAAGARLAGLHGAQVAGPPRTLADDLAELREYVAPMAQADPALAPRYAAIVERIASSAGADASAPVAAHGAFRTDQYLIEGDDLVMIDLDGFCWAEPERDLGNFLAYLRWKAIRKPADAAFIERAGQVFMEGYTAAAPTPHARRLAIYEADSLLKIAGRRYRSLTVKEWPLVPRLVEAAEKLRIEN